MRTSQEKLTKKTTHSMKKQLTTESSTMNSAEIEKRRPRKWIHRKVEILPADRKWAGLTQWRRGHHQENIKNRQDMLASQPKMTILSPAQLRSSPLPSPQKTAPTSANKRTTSNTTSSFQWNKSRRRTSSRRAVNPSSPATAACKLRSQRRKNPRYRRR